LYFDIFSLLYPLVIISNEIITRGYNNIIISRIIYAGGLIVANILNKTISKGLLKEKLIIEKWVILILI
jgi:hypothetical protein